MSSNNYNIMLDLLTTLLTTQSSGGGLLTLGLFLCLGMAGYKVGQSLGWFQYTKRDYRNDTSNVHYVERMVAHKDDTRKAHHLAYGARMGSVRKEPIWEEDDFGHKKMIGKKMLLAGHSYYRTEIDPETGEPVKIWCQDNVDVSEYLERGYSSDDIKDKLL